MTLGNLSRIERELPQREAIRDCLFRFARGVDRRDEHLIRSAFWPDVDYSHPPFLGDLDDYIGWALPNLRTLEMTVHLLPNIFIQLQGDRALVETYVYGLHRLTIDGTMRDLVAAARYLDVFERRGDDLRIGKRRVIVDWFREYSDSGDFAKGLFGSGPLPQGRSAPADDSYAWLGMTSS
jgi:SnoaL-like domain